MMTFPSLSYDVMVTMDLIAFLSGLAIAVVTARTSIEISRENLVFIINLYVKQGPGIVDGCFCNVCATQHVGNFFDSFFWL